MSSQSKSILNNDPFLNRTGIEGAPGTPVCIQMQSTPQSLQETDSPHSRLFELRKNSIIEAQSLGAVPTPTSIKGLYAAGAQIYKGKEPSVFLDLLGERLAFERTCIRLYDALIMKFQALELNYSFLSLDQLVHFRNREATHFQLIRDTLIDLGADPTAVTPSADATGVASQGLVQVITDPRSTLLQSLQALLIAELTDEWGWSLLTLLAEKLGYEAHFEKFSQVLAEQKVKLEKIRKAHENLLFKSAKITE